MIVVRDKQPFQSLACTLACVSSGIHPVVFLILSVVALYMYVDSQ